MDLVGGWPTPLKKIRVKVNWDDDIPNWMETSFSHVPVTTNQPLYQWQIQKFRNRFIGGTYYWYGLCKGYMEDPEMSIDYTTIDDMKNPSDIVIMNYT